MIMVNGQPVDFRPDMVLADVLKETGIDTESPVLITIDGVHVDKQNIRSVKLRDDAEINVLPFLSGG